MNAHSLEAIVFGNLSRSLEPVEIEGEARDLEKDEAFMAFVRSLPTNMEFWHECEAHFSPDLARMLILNPAEALAHVQDVIQLQADIAAEHYLDPISKYGQDLKRSAHMASTGREFKFTYSNATGVEIDWQN